MLKIKSTQIARMSISFYVGYLRNELIIAHAVMAHDSNQKRAAESRQQHRDDVCTLHFEHIFKRDAKAGSCTPDRTLTQMGCNPYANCFSDEQSCVFEPFVIFVVRKNYLANYVLR